MDAHGRWRLADERGFGVTLATNTISVEDRLPTDDGSGIICEIVGTIVESPINLGGGRLEPEEVDLR
ncbi:MAG: hypothetical protein ACOYMC_11895 [Pirellulales bacterium]